MQHFRDMVLSDPSVLSLCPLHMARRPNEDFLIFFLSVVKVILDTKFFRQCTSGGVFFVFLFGLK